MAQNLGLKQFRAEGCLSYVVWERASRQAILVDPSFELMDEYRSFITDQGLTLKYALDTHTHADHYSASHMAAEQFGAQITMSHRTQSERPTLKLRVGDHLQLGNARFNVLETPGHTPDSICLEGEGLVFTGDTLLIGASGRTDFPGSDPLQQYHSLHDVLFKLLPSTIVLPGHDYSDLLFSLLEVEKRKNPHLLIATVEAFTKFKNDEILATGVKEMKAQLAFNLARAPQEAPNLGQLGCKTACGAAIPQDDRFMSINVQKFSQKLRDGGKGTRFIDVREPEEFAAGHMPGTRNIPLSEIALFLREFTQPGEKVYLSCLGGKRSASAAKTLSYLGIEDVVNVNGGFQAWTQAGLPVER